MDNRGSPTTAAVLPGKAYTYALNFDLLRVRPGAVASMHGGLFPGLGPVETQTVTLAVRVRVSAAVEPLLRGYMESMHPSPLHGGKVVSLAMYAVTNGQLQVHARLPIDGYADLVRERFDTAGPAIAAWRAHYLALFGVDPLE